jgi:hypothetical protein
MSLLDKASKLAKSERAQELLHKVEEKAKDPELRAKVQGTVQGAVETVKDKAEVVVDRAQEELAKRRGEGDEGQTAGGAAAADASPEAESTVTPPAAAEPHDGRSASQRNEDEIVDPTAGPEGDLPS